MVQKKGEYATIPKYDKLIITNAIFEWGNLENPKNRDNNKNKPIKISMTHQCYYDAITGKKYKENNSDSLYTYYIDGKIQIKNVKM